MIQRVVVDFGVPPAGGPPPPWARGLGLLAQFRELLDRAMSREPPPGIARSTEARREAAPIPIPEPQPVIESLATAFRPAWEQNVTGVAPDGSVSTYNPLHFATRETAEQLAAMLGGAVVEENLQGSFTRSQPERLIVVGEARLNAGLLADLLNKYPPAVADAMIQDIIDRANAPGKKPSPPGEDS